MLLLALIALISTYIGPTNRENTVAAPALERVAPQPQAHLDERPTTAVLPRIIDDEPRLSPPASFVLHQGLPSPALLERSVERVLADRSVEYVKVGARVMGRRVTVINVWANWCKPCEGELSGLRRLFTEMAWDDVSFVPIQADDTPPAWSFDRITGRMPASADFLVDPGIVAALRQGGLIDARAELPITMLIDCRRELRASHVGALDEGGVAALRSTVDVLRAELSTSYCLPPKRTQRERCGADFCAPTDVCRRVGHEARCILRTGGLK